MKYDFYMNDISVFLQEKNLKKTPLRVSIIEIFSAAQEPLTIAQLEKQIQQKGISANQTSLYRQIETLVEKNIVQSLVLKNSTAHYELQKHHHHHFICERCESIECVDDENLEKYIHSFENKLKQRGISISSHQFSFHGKCTSCTL